MGQALLYEINTRCWLERLRELRGRGLHLGNLPDSFIAEIAEKGFTHLWAMGVWTTGEMCRKHALQYWKPGALRRDPSLCRCDEDILGSPYAISAYRVPERLGGEEGLASFRRQLHRHGLKLILDFVPNHLAIDHHWLAERPDLFAQSSEKREGAFRVEGLEPSCWFAHGRDPFFPPWSDTAQLDYRKPQTHQAMRELLLSVAKRCDGVRCDMAMLLLQDVFEKTWSAWPLEGQRASGEFWAEAIGAARAEHPDFLMIAEAYWALEARLQALGFDFTYEKTSLDLLERKDFAGALSRLAQLRPEYAARSVWFLENHDEQRIASRLSDGLHRVAAALLLLGVPGMPLLYEGQGEGWTQFVPVQVGRWPDQPSSPDIKRMYESLLRARKHAALEGSEWSISTLGKEAARVRWVSKERVCALLLNFGLGSVELDHAWRGLMDEISGTPLGTSLGPHQAAFARLR